MEKDISRRQLFRLGRALLSTLLFSACDGKPLVTVERSGSVQDGPPLSKGEKESLAKTVVASGSSTDVDIIVSSEGVPSFNPSDYKSPSELETQVPSYDLVVPQIPFKDLTEAINFQFEEAGISNPPQFEEPFSTDYKTIIPDGIPVYLNPEYASQESQVPGSFIHLSENSIIINDSRDLYYYQDVGIGFVGRRLSTAIGILASDPICSDPAFIEAAKAGKVAYYMDSGNDGEEKNIRTLLYFRVNPGEIMVHPTADWGFSNPNERQ